MPLTGDYEPSPQAWVRDQVELYERTDGAEGNTLMDTGLPVIIVTNVGASSGKLRKTPLMRVEHDGAYALVGSQGGAPTDPAWVANVRAHPQVDVRDRGVVTERTVREITGDEKAEWWDRCVAAYPPYADYQARTDRVIPVFLAELA